MGRGGLYWESCGSSGTRTCQAVRIGEGVERRCVVSSGGILPNDYPSPEEVLEALREDIINNPRLDDMPVEEIARQLVLEGHLEQEPPLTLVEDALDSDELPPPYFVEDRSEPARGNLSGATLAVCLRTRCMNSRGTGCAIGATPCFGRLRCSERATSPTRRRLLRHSPPPPTANTKVCATRRTG